MYKGWRLIVLTTILLTGCRLDMKSLGKWVSGKGGGQACEPAATGDRGGWRLYHGLREEVKQMSQWCTVCKKWTWWTKYRDGYSCNEC
jgi:hypothetical protein